MRIIPMPASAHNVVDRQVSSAVSALAAAPSNKRKAGASDNDNDNDNDNSLMDDEMAEEPDQGDFTPIYSGRHVWSATRSDKPKIPYEELPFPSLRRPLAVYRQV
jgi:hypothetical protein